MNRFKSLTASFALAVTTIALPAHGALLTGSIDGQVTSAGSAVRGVSAGSPVTGSYTYNTSTPFNGLLGVTDPLIAFSLTIGTNPYVFSLTDLASAMPTRAGVVPGNSTTTANELFFFFFTNTAIQNFVGGVYGTQTISNSPAESFVVNIDAAHSFSFDFTAKPAVATFAAVSSTATVPEPSSAALVALGCAAFLVKRRRRSAAR